MRIAESSINMGSARLYSQTGSRAGSKTNSSFLEEIKGAAKSRTKDSDGFSFSNTDNGMSGNDLFENTYGYGKNLERMNGNSISEADSEMTPATQFQNMLLSLILARFKGAGLFGGGAMQQITTYQEYESTEFHADGVARTEDGRTIRFNVDIMMSRSYREYMNVYAPNIQSALCDPLVINVGSDVADIRDQKFMFDIDADGKKDSISMLGRGSGFLALDKNGDGTINDGSELFGTKSGDGFADLREYDSDGNGWIDENDAVFEKLRVWCKDENGEDILMNLKEADIGAIYLGAQSTEFTLHGMDGATDGVIRSTGLFLRESGSVSTMQHVDMAVGSEGEEAEEIQALQGTVQTVSFTVSSSSETRRSETSRSQARRRDSLTQKRAVEKKEAAELKKKRELEREASRELTKEHFDRQYERSQNAEELAKMHEEGRHNMEKYFSERFRKMEEERQFLEEDPIDRLFEDTGIYSFI